MVSCIGKILLSILFANLVNKTVMKTSKVDKGGVSENSDSHQHQ